MVSFAIIYYYFSRASRFPLGWTLPIFYTAPFVSHLHILFLFLCEYSIWVYLHVQVKIYPCVYMACVQCYYPSTYFLRQSLLLDKDLVAIARLVSQGNFCICLTLSSNPQELGYRYAVLYLAFIWLLRASCLLIKHFTYWSFSTDIIWILLQSQGRRVQGNIPSSMEYYLTFKKNGNLPLTTTCMKLAAFFVNIYFNKKYSLCWGIYCMAEVKILELYNFNDL